MTLEICKLHADFNHEYSFTIQKFGLFATVREATFCTIAKPTSAKHKDFL